jgi:hypothetical protein
VSPRRNQRREQGLRCALMPGECFTSEATANEMRLTRQLNVARGGMVRVEYHVKKCLCGRYHLITDEHLREWEAKRKEE